MAINHALGGLVINYQLQGQVTSEGGSAHDSRSTPYSFPGANSVITEATPDFEGIGATNINVDNKATGTSFNFTAHFVRWA